MDRLKKAVLYVLYTLNELEDDGLVESRSGSRIRVTPRGIASFDQLKASGFRPLPNEIDGILSNLMGEYFSEQLTQLVKMRIENKI